MQAQVTSGAPKVSERMLGRVFVYGFLLFFLVITLVPLLLIWSSAFKTNPEIAADPLGLPSELYLDNLDQAWTAGNFSTYMGNSFLVATATTIIVVIAAVLGGYSLSSIPLPGARLITLFFLFGMAIPIHGILIPQYSVMRELKLINNLWSVIILLAALNISFGIYMMRAAFTGIPAELSEAALIDGCSDRQVLQYVLVPVIRPAIAALCVFIFMWSWNDLLLPLIYLQDDSLRTVSVGLTFYQGKFTVDYALTAAGTTIATVPILIFYVIFQRQFIEGLTAGSLAGT